MDKCHKSQTSPSHTFSWGPLHCHHYISILSSAWLFASMHFLLCTNTLYTVEWWNCCTHWHPNGPGQCCEATQRAQLWHQYMWYGELCQNRWQLYAYTVKVYSIRFSFPTALFAFACIIIHSNFLPAEWADSSGPGPTGWQWCYGSSSVGLKLKICGVFTLHCSLITTSN